MFSFAQHHKYSLEELGNLIPFEREIYLQLLVQHLKDVEAEEKRVQGKYK